MKRILTAVVLAPCIVYTVVAAPSWLFAAVVVAISVLCFYEYSGIVAAQGIEAPGVLGYGAGLVLLFIQHSEFAFLAALTLCAMALAMRFGDLAKSLPYTAALVMGVLYVFGTWRFAFLLRPISPHWLMFALALNWIGDTAAYYVGRRWGRHRLAPQVSPKKSIEGSMASVVASALFGYFYLGYFLPSVSVVDVIAVSVLANAAGQIGDLAESALKRGAGVKDSGNTLPGHGGWLDRVDSSLFAMPVIYLYLLRPWAALLP